MRGKKDRKKLLLCAIILGLSLKKKKDKVEKRKWCKDWLTNRKQLGSNATIFRELQAENISEFTNYVRMDPSTFYKLLAKVKPYIEKQDTRLRDSITAEARLEATLLYLCHGCVNP